MAATHDIATHFLDDALLQKSAYKANKCNIMRLQARRLVATCGVANCQNNWVFSMP